MRSRIRATTIRTFTMIFQIDTEIDPSVRRGHVREVAPKTLLFGEGDPNHGIMAVLDGCIVLTRALADGRRQIVDLLGPGDLFGFEAGATHDCAAEAVTRSRIRAYHPTSPMNAMIAGTLLKRAGRALSRQRDHAFLLGRKSARERVASGLLRLDDVLGGGSGRFECPLTRQDLGDWLGLVLETVSRTLSGLQREGLIVVHEQTDFEIPDRERLTAAAALPADRLRQPPAPPRRRPALREREAA